MLAYNCLDSEELMRPESQVPREADRVDPELDGVLIPIDMNMGRLVGLMAMEVRALRTITVTFRYVHVCYNYCECARDSRW